MLILHNETLLSFLRDRYSLQDIQALITFLEAQGTFRFAPLATGLFSAAITRSQTEYTGYQQVWVRDNIHVAHALKSIGQTELALGVAHGLMRYFQQHRDRFTAIIADPSLAQNAMNRPHIRFDGQTLQELEVSWSHAQNDALGYFLWFYCQQVQSGDIELNEASLETLMLFPRYFESIQYWQDADQGHWEETAKVEASSIGTVIAGLKALLQLGIGGDRFKSLPALIRQGEAALAEILPYESRQPERRYDAALLFLIYPLQVVSDDRATQIIHDVMLHLQGDIGIRRYLLDSFWAPDYKTQLPPAERTTNYSEDLSERDALITLGQEAQWCIFDPILSAIFGQRYQASQDPQDLQWQTHYLNRSLAQLTDPHSEAGALQAPELYYLESGVYQPNDATPLLWTQANLRLALQKMCQSLS